jgi:hypothetical protein
MRHTSTTLHCTVIDRAKYAYMPITTIKDLVSVDRCDPAAADATASLRSHPRVHDCNRTTVLYNCSKLTLYHYRDRVTIFDCNRATDMVRFWRPSETTAITLCPRLH